MRQWGAGHLDDGSEEVADLDAHKNALRRFVPGPAIDERVAQIEANGAITFMHTDRQSSVVAISDSSGNVSAQNRRAYGTYGETNPAQMTGTGSHPFGYTGRRWDNDLGLYYYRARWYDPQLGTFLETDPIGSLDYVNLYSYVGAEPGNATDPTGMAGCSDTAAQNLQGPCIDSSNFRAADLLEKNGRVKTPNNSFDKNAIGTATTDAAAKADAKRTDQFSGNEQASRVDVTADLGGTKIATISQIEVINPSPTGGSLPVTAITGADAVIHTHPTRDNLIVPGEGDWQVPAQGVASYISHGERSIVVEISGGQVRMRVVSGSLDSEERKQIRDRLNEFQRRGVSY